MGASVRSLAWSALRAGFQPIGLDLFGDQDLLAVGPAQRIVARDYPLGLEKLAASYPDAIPCVYSGAMENHPRLVDALSRQRPLWGICGNALRAARDPVRVATVLREAGLPAPQVRFEPAGVPRDGTWIQKPLASAGGRRIEVWASGSTRFGEPSYFQQRLVGDTLAAVYLARVGQAELLGVTRQVLGRGGSEFAYQGSCGPVALAPKIRQQFEKIGSVFASELGLAGLFGVDTVLHEGEPWVVEINPRYSASVEVLELSQGRAFLREHALAFGAVEDLETARAVKQDRPAVVGKMIVDASGRFQVGDVKIPASLDLWKAPEVADVPQPGTEFRVGEPVLTVFETGSSVEECLAGLQRRAEDWRQRIQRFTGIATGATSPLVDRWR
ncbi:MAG TPA: ATP-grasp domain-containing protein [Isosphaeraceae bacterium]|nr:ATP-grasp domain-containing protein [Isosphaeraceae bacterium]